MKWLLAALFLLLAPLASAQGISQLQQFTSTTSPASAITQSTYGKAFRLSGQAAGCGQFSANGTLTSTGTNCGSGGGGNSFAYPFIGNATSTVITFSNGITANVTGNVTGSAATLATPRTINGVSFNGSANIVVASTTLLADFNTFAQLITGSISGNAGTATKLATTRAINGVNFDGSAPITIFAATSTLLSDFDTFTHLITGSISGNAATVTTNANLSGVVTSSGNATSFGSQLAGVLGSVVTGNTGVLATTTLFGTLGAPGTVLMSSNGLAVWSATSTGSGLAFAYPFTPTAWGTVTVSATTTTLLAAGGVFGTSTIGTLVASSSITNLGVKSALVLDSTTGLQGAYGGAAGCTNQFVTALSALGASTCTSLTLAAFPTIGANTVLANSTGATAIPTAVATSSLFTYSPGLTQSNGLQKQIENRGFSYATSTAWTGTTTIQLGVAYGEVWNTAKCYTDAGTLNVDFVHAATHFTFFNASTTKGQVNMNAAADTSGDSVSVAVGTPASSPTVIACTVSDTN